MSHTWDPDRYLTYADPPIRFTALLSLLIDEALVRHRDSQLPDDPVPAEARLQRRP